MTSATVNCTKHRHMDEFILHDAINSTHEYNRLAHAVDRATVRLIRRHALMFAIPTIQQVRLKRQAYSLATTLLTMARDERAEMGF